MSDNLLTYSSNPDKPNISKTAADLELEDFANPIGAIDPNIFEAAFGNTNYNFNQFQSPLSSCLTPDNLNNNLDNFNYNQDPLIEMNQDNPFLQLPTINTTSDATSATIKVEEGSPRLFSDVDNNQNLMSSLSINTPIMDSVSPYNVNSFYSPQQNVNIPPITENNNPASFYPLIPNNLNTYQTPQAQYNAQDYMNLANAIYALNGISNYNYLYPTILNNYANNFSTPLPLSTAIPSAITNPKLPISKAASPIKNAKIENNINVNSDTKKEPIKSSRAPDRPKIVPCTFPGCNKMFSRYYNMKAHLEIHNPLRVKPYQCHHCQRPFMRKHDLTRHIKTIHLDKRR